MKPVSKVDIQLTIKFKVRDSVSYRPFCNFNSEKRVVVKLLYIVIIMPLNLLFAAAFSFEQSSIFLSCRDDINR